MDHQTEHALHNLLAGSASEQEIELIKQKLSSGQVSIGGNVSQSVIILGDGNTVQLTPQALDALNGRNLLGDLERDLTGAEIEFGLTRLAELLSDRAPTLRKEFETLSHRIRPTLRTDPRALGSESHAERTETLAHLNRLCMEVTDIAFNALCTGIEPPAYDSRSPFRGLESFRPEDAPYFFGREALTRKLVQKLNEHNFLAVLGASGSGKSSLVMAGLIPALNVPHAVFRPGVEPLSELEKALQAGPQLLVVDQFEELFTLSAREQRELCSDFISRLLEQSHRLRVVITLRADFLGEVAPFKSLKDEVQNHQEIIPPMDEAELRRAMEGQAGCARLRFESNLSQQMLDDVSGEPGAMPLLQHALWTLWTRRHGRWLRAEEYRAFGGVKQAIASTAEAVFARCNDFEKERLRDIFLRLTRLDAEASADGRDTRRRVLLRDLIPADSDPESTKLLIKQLADARLLVVTGDEVEVAHEALIRHWERLRAWLNDDRDNLRLREGVSDDARRWENAHRDESLLNHRGPRLELALAMSKNPRYRLNPVEQAYLDECVGLHVRERKSETFRRVFLAGTITISIAVVSTIATLAITGQLNRLVYHPLPMEWVQIPAGEFWMGSSNEEIALEQAKCQECDFSNEQPKHLVSLDAFDIGRFEVTNQQYQQCVLAGVCNRPIGNNEYSDPNFKEYPITNVTWSDAKEFCEWYGAHLPSEAEWEMAAKGSTQTRPQPGLYPWGSELDKTKLNFGSSSSAPVGTFSPAGDSPYGIADLSGNVWEWVSDFYFWNYCDANLCKSTNCSASCGYDPNTPLPNPKGPADFPDQLNPANVIRGGAFTTSDEYYRVVEIRSTYRAAYAGFSQDIGFRCAK